MNHQQFVSICCASPNSSLLLFNFDYSAHFSLVQMLAWTCFAAMSSSWAAAMFASVGATVMGSWAKERHYAYLRNYEGYPRDRCAMVPYLF